MKKEWSEIWTMLNWWGLSFLAKYRHNVRAMSFPVQVSVLIGKPEKLGSFGKFNSIDMFIILRNTGLKLNNYN